ncbi:MAG: hypothetical protein M3336_16500, partial [Chloroflexota bacterium]|nr:hypothetical protein [Chloroflexota bacterium]
MGLGIAVLAIGAWAASVVSTPGASMLVWAVIATLLLALAIAVLLWGLAYRRLVYTLTESTLELPWCGVVTVVPYAAIDGV